MLSVGEILRNEREKLGYTLRQVEKEIKVREQFLRAVEENDWDAFSSKIYISGVIKNYAKFLDLDNERMMAFFRRDYEKREDMGFRKKVSSSYLRPETKIIMYVGSLIIFLLFFGYFMYQLKVYLSPPKVVITSPNQNLFRSIEAVRISGTADKESTVTVSGEHVYQNKDGTFEYSYPLKRGKNNVVIEVIGANGKKTVITKSLILE